LAGESDKKFVESDGLNEHVDHLGRSEKKVD
jgi:hypothetical protein